MAPSGTLQLPDAHGYLDRVIGELRALDAPQKNTLVNVLEYLSDHIRVTRDEIGALRMTGDSPIFSTTTDELEEIVTETARAANRIMDAAETVENVAATLEEPITANVLMSAVTEIYEASAFQDITGQRISKIVCALQSLEENMASLMKAFGPLDDRFAKQEREGDAALLNGPQLEEKASSQTDIDALFASLS
jgi:chemotaxis protein CheZ